MNMKPLYESDSLGEMAIKIKDNIGSIASELYASKDQVTLDKIELLEFAVEIEDKKTRDEFVSLISKWHSRATESAEAYDCLKSISKQIDAMCKKGNE